MRGSSTNITVVSFSGTSIGLALPCTCGALPPLEEASVMTPFWKRRWPSILTWNRVSAVLFEDDQAQGTAFGGALGHCAGNANLSGST